jgi:hypothetical protein
LPTSELASCADVRAVTEEDLRTAQLLWATVDSPWVSGVDRKMFERSLEPLRAMAPSAVFSTHLPPGVGGLDEFLETLRLAPGASPFTGPDQHALEEMLAGFEPAPPVGAVLTGAP